MKYEYVNVKTFGIYQKTSYDHRAIIDEYAKKGYRFVCWIPDKMAFDGILQSYDLVFEKDED